MPIFISKLKKFFIDFKNDSRIPMRDKKLLLIFFLAGTIPNILSPELSANPYFLVTSFVILAFIPDYLFNVLDQTLLLSLYPFDMKSYQSLKRFCQFIALFAPSFIANHIWEYQKDPI